MTLFWIGIAIFTLGVVIRCYCRVKYYRDYKNNAHTDMQKQELRSKYRPMILVGLAIEAIGCIVGVISIWAS